METQTSSLKRVELQVPETNSERSGEGGHALPYAHESVLVVVALEVECLK